jgi:hypothetical protein
MPAVAADFDYLKDMNIQAQADPSGFRTKLCLRFGMSDEKVEAIIQSVDKPADAYMVMRIGQLGGQPPERVITEYKKKKGRGWGVIAKNLGIKPGSKEFHALKRGDLDEDTVKGKGKGKGRGKKFRD